MRSRSFIPKARKQRLEAHADVVGVWVSFFFSCCVRLSRSCSGCAGWLARPFWVRLLYTASLKARSPNLPKRGSGSRTSTHKPLLPSAGDACCSILSRCLMVAPLMNTHSHTRLHSVCCWSFDPLSHLFRSCRLVSRAHTHSHLQFLSYSHAFHPTPIPPFSTHRLVRVLALVVLLLELRLLVLRVIVVHHLGARGGGAARGRVPRRHGGGGHCVVGVGVLVVWLMVSRCGKAV